MENLKSFKRAQICFQTWGPERKKVLEELKTIRDEIQEQARIHSIGSITYTGVGLVGGTLFLAGIIAAPFTFGASLALTVAGAATGVTSGVAGVTHGMVRIGIVKSRCEDAKASLEKHEATCKEMKTLVLSLKTEIKTFRDRHTLEISHEREMQEQIAKAWALCKPIENLVQHSKVAHVYRTTGSMTDVAKVMDLGKSLDDMFPSSVKDVTNKGATKISTVGLTALAVVRILTDISSIISKVKDLNENNKLCVEAKKFQDVIEQMQNEYDVLKERFV